MRYSHVQVIRIAGALCGLTYFIAAATAQQQGEPGQFPESWAGNPAPHECRTSLADARGLIEVLKRFHFSRVGFGRKAESGQFFIPNTERKAVVHRWDVEGEHHLEQIRQHLTQLSTTVETAALILDIGTAPQSGGRYVCSWLLSSAGLIAAAATFPDLEEYGARPIAEVISNRLKVATRSAAREPRSLGEQCRRDRSGVPEFCRMAVAATQSVASPAADLKEASRLLLPPPVADAIAGANIKRLLVLPSGDLSTVPYAALGIGSQLLVERLSLVILPDIGGLFSREWEEKDPLAGAKLVVGNPDLRRDKQHCYCPLDGAEREANYVAQLIDARALTGASATQKAVLQRLREDQANLSLIYLASHGQAHATNPLGLSYIALANDPLIAWKIRDYKLTAQPLVVLSACNTARGKTFEGGIFGLARAWHYAGAPRVVMSLWSIDDEATEALMREFMQAIVRRVPVEEALRVAMLLTMKNDRYRDPALWAGFSVFGLPTRR